MLLRWLEQSEADVPPGNDWLCAREADSLAALRFPKRRADWRLGRWTAKCAVAACRNERCAFPDLEIRGTPSGAPAVFQANSPVPLVISISHRNGRACCAVADHGIELGCDLEWVEPRSPAFIADYLTPGEQHLVGDCSPANRPLLACLLWSAKESALKAMQAGLRVDTRLVVVEIPRILDGALLHPDTWRPIRVKVPAREYHGWWAVSGQFVRTVVAAPSQQPPVQIQESEMACVICWRRQPPGQPSTHPASS
jgi:4'-phosphopantetheinyl transferase